MRMGPMFWLGVVLVFALFAFPQLLLPAIGVVMVCGLAGWALWAWLRVGMRRRGWRR